MSDLLFYAGMVLMIFVVMFAIVRVAESYKTSLPSSEHRTQTQPEATQPLRTQRAQEIWNRLNPKIYLDDDETEPLPRKRIRAKIKSS